MQTNFQLLKSQLDVASKKINKIDIKKHIIVTDNYSNLCMNFFADQYNTLVAQMLAEQSCIVSGESEATYINWLNKE